MHALKLRDTKPRAKYATVLYLVFMRTTDSGIMLNTTAMKPNFQSLCLIMTKRIAGKGIKLLVNLGKADPQVNIKTFRRVVLMSVTVMALLTQSRQAVFTFCAGEKEKLPMECSHTKWSLR